MYRPQSNFLNFLKFVPLLYLYGPQFSFLHFLNGRHTEWYVCCMLVYIKMDWKRKLDFLCIIVFENKITYKTILTSFTNYKMHKIQQQKCIIAQQLWLYMSSYYDLQLCIENTVNLLLDFIAWRDANHLPPPTIHGGKNDSINKTFSFPFEDMTYRKDMFYITGQLGLDVVGTEA